MWINEDASTSTTAKKQRLMKKAIKLQDERTVTVDWYVNKRLPDIFAALSMRDLFFHHNNVTTRAAHMTVEYLRENKMRSDRTTTLFAEFSNVCLLVMF